MGGAVGEAVGGAVGGDVGGAVGGEVGGAVGGVVGTTNIVKVWMTECCIEVSADAITMLHHTYIDTSYRCVLAMHAHTP